MLPDDLERLLDGRVRGGPQGDLLGLALAAGQDLQVLGDGAARRLSKTSVAKFEDKSRVKLSCSKTWPETETTHNGISTPLLNAFASPTWPLGPRPSNGCLFVPSTPRGGA